MKLMKNIARSIRKASLIVLAGASLSAYADSIFRGARGPTEWQADARISVGERANDSSKTKSFVNNNIIKYWSGDSLGLFGFASIPYKSVNNGKFNSNGLGDITIGVGPRGSYTNSIGSLHCSSYAGIVIPIGDSSSKPSLGNNRWDMKFGIGLTYFTPKRNGEIDFVFDYTIAEPGKLNASDDIYLGALVGGKVSKHFRAGAGLIGNIKNSGTQSGNYLLTYRTAVRYIHSKRWHVELWSDVDVASKNMPSGLAGTLALRYNF